MLPPKSRLAKAAVTVSLLVTASNITQAQNTGYDEDGVEEIIVTGRLQKLYRVEETSVSKLPTHPLASSQVVTVITKDLIEDQGARDSQDIYRNISGVTVFSYAGVTARGFRQEENFYDGLRGDPYAGFSVPQLFNVERVEYLKGPAGMLYGQSAPGGLFNYVTKKPSFESEAEISAVLGSHDRVGGSGTITGQVAENIAAYAGAFYEQRDTSRYNSNSEVLILDAGLTAQLPVGDLTLQGTRYVQNLDGNRLRGIPTDDDGNFLTTIKWNHNEPDDFLDMDANVLQASYDAVVSESFSFNAAVRYRDGFEEQKYHEPRGLFDSDGDGALDASSREYRDQDRSTESWSYGANAIWSQGFGSIENRILFGMDHYTQTYIYDYLRARGNTEITEGLPTPLSLFDPEYGVTDPSSYTLSVVQDGQTSKTRRTGFYVLEEATLGKFVFVAGGRYDSYQDTQDESELTGNTWTWRLGLVYQATDGVSLFGQYATSFEPQTIANSDPLRGGPFEPTKGDIFEAGFKTELLDGRIQSSASIYQIRKRNLLQADPRGDVEDDGLDDYLAFGEVTSKGFDIDLAADITPDWVFTLAYGYNDTKITEGAGGTGIRFNIGDRFANAPKHQLGFWTRYQLPELDLALAFGGDYVSKRLSISGQTVKPYIVFDASVIYDFGDFSLLLRADNLFDKTYAASGFIDRTGHFPGEPRSVFAELRYRFN